MSEVVTKGGKRQAPGEPLLRLGWFDWMFVVASWLVCIHALYILLQLGNGARSVDFMPVVVCVPTILVGWRGVRLRDRVKAGLESLNNGAAFILPDERAMQKFRDDMEAAVRRLSRNWAVGIAGTLLLICGVLWWGGQMSSQISVLTPIMGVSGLLIGLLLGRLMAFGSLFKVMDRNEIKLAGLSTPGARLAMIGLESVFSFSTLATSLLCVMFSGWWIFWALGFQQYREQWSVPFAGLWIISFCLYLLAARSPALSFQAHLAKLYGNSTGRERSLEEAKAELASMIASPEARNRQTRNEVQDLEQYIKHLNELQFRSNLLGPRLLNGLMILLLLLMAAPVIALRGGL
jgi:hypothetical protein